MKTSQIVENNFATIRAAIAEVLEKEECAYSTDVIFNDGEILTHNYYGSCDYEADYDFVFCVSPAMKQAVDEGIVDADLYATELLDNAIEAISFYNI